MVSLGKALVAGGILLAALGLICLGRGTSIPFLSRFGRLPGDIYVGRGNFTFYFPLASGIVISVVLSILFAWLRR